MNTTTLIAPDISCEHCKRTIEREVGAMEGVHSCTVEIPIQRVTVTYDPALTSREEIAALLDDEGYPVAS